MGTQKSFIKLEGTFDDLTFYERKGKQLVRKKGSLNKQRIENDPKFQRTRENMNEFTGAALVSMTLRKSLGSLIKRMGGTTTSARLTGIFRRMSSKGPGKRGRRSFILGANKPLFHGFEFNKERAFDSVFSALYDAPSIDANRSVVTWTVPAFEMETELKLPEGTTHYQFVLATTLLSDHVYDEEFQAYVPVAPELNGSRQVTLGELLPADVTLTEEAVLSTDLGLTEALPDTVVSLSVIGVLFFQETADGEFYPLQGAQSLAIATIA